MKYHVAVGTHQKTGTVWMHDTFKDLAESLNTPYKNVSRLETSRANTYVGKLSPARSGHGIVFHNHSVFPGRVNSRRFRGLHIVRDPRDMIISAARYHETTDAKWANRPNPRYGGKSLRKAIADLPSLEDKLLFEIEHVAETNISEMAEFQERDVFVTVRYEDLVQDGSMEITSRLLWYLGFDETECLFGLICFWRNSLFGLKRNQRTGHIRNGQAKQHETVYTERVRSAFEERFPDVVERLGYGKSGDQPALPEALASTTLPGVVEQARQKFIADGDTALEQVAELVTARQSENPLAHLQLARVRMDAGALSTARQAASRAARLDPALPAPQYLLGDIAAKQDDMNAAVDAYYAGLEQDRRNVVRVVTLADMELARGNHGNARTLVEQTMSRVGENRTLADYYRRLTRQNVRNG